MVWSRVSPSGGNSLYDLLTLGEHISILHMKNEIQIWPKCGTFSHFSGFILFFYGSVFLKSSFPHEQSPLQALSASIWGWRYFISNNMLCLFLKEWENTPLGIKSNNQGQPIDWWKWITSVSAFVISACPNRSISPPSYCFIGLALDSFVHMLLLPRSH